MVFSKILLAALLLAAALFIAPQSPLTAAKSSADPAVVSERKASTPLRVSRVFSCTRSWGANREAKMKMVMVFIGTRQGKKFYVSSIGYSFQRQRGPVSLGDSNNIDVFPAAAGSRALWNSPDNLKSGSNNSSAADFVLPWGRTLRVVATFDILGDDPSCTARGRLRFIN